MTGSLKLSLATLAGAASLLALLGAAGYGSIEPATAAPQSTETAAPKSTETVLTCSLCLEDSGEHIFPNGDQTVFCDGGGNNEDCASCGGTSECHDYWDDGPCHVDCSEEFAATELDSLLEAVRIGDANRIAAIVEANPASVIVNHRRSAIQIPGCGENIAWHLPIAAPLLETVQAALD